MPLTEANPVRLGAPAPDFALPDTNGRVHRLSDFDAAPALLVAFISNTCPFVVHISEEFARFARDFADRGVAVVAINANDDATRPDENLAALGIETARAGYGFPYLKDAGQEVARAYGAACTPDLFLYDRDRRLAYHGQFDDSRPKNGKPVTGVDLRAAVVALLAGGRPAETQVRSIGCNIKWRPGNEPAVEGSAAA